MDINPPFIGQNPMNKEIEILSELRQANRYLEVLVDLFAKAFPDAASGDLGQRIQEAKTREPIGFKSDNKNG